jgi:hypothetical protein
MKVQLLLTGRALEAMPPTPRLILRASLDQDYDVLLNIFVSLTVCLFVSFPPCVRDIVFLVRLQTHPPSAL